MQTVVLPVPECYNTRKAFGSVDTAVKKHHWVLSLILQIVFYAAATAVGVIGTLMVPTTLTGLVFHLVNWVLLPVLGAVSAYRTTRGGVYYLGAWIAPPVLMLTIYWGMTGLPPQHAMMVILCALLSIIGAAAGHEMNKRKE